MGLQAEAERLAGDELGLRHRAFGRVDQQDHAVDHAEDPLDLGAEVGVARGVDDVDPVAVPLDRGALGEDGDPALLFQVVGIHGPFLHALILAESAGLAEQLVDKRGLAVVDVGDDRHVAEAHGVRTRLEGVLKAGPLSRLAALQQARGIQVRIRPRDGPASRPLPPPGKGRSGQPTGRSTTCPTAVFEAGTW